MMKKLILVVLLFALPLMFLSGCAAYSVAPVTGFIYTEVKAPMGATSNENATKMGISSATSILGLVATGDASIEAAKKNGNITKVTHVDYSSKSILGIYAEFKTIVYGE
ncbi:MAG: TRL-like family protein [Calditrichia bacterium]